MKTFSTSVLGLALVFSTLSFAAEVTIEGVISKVVPEEREIYVKDEKKKHEFYFTKDTTLKQKGEAAEFSALKVDQKVKVVADKKGKRLIPKAVEILE